MDGKTKVCGIIANPVEHSMSPVLQNLFAERTGVNLAYVPFKVEPEQLEEAVRGAYAMNILGLNVTVPHKQAVMRCVKELDETAAHVGAVNTLVRTEGGYKGYNTDVPGLSRAVKKAGISVRGRGCILIGAGGAARAAAYMMMAGKAEHIFILNRSPEKGQALADWINGLAGRSLAEALALSDYGKIPGNGYFAVQSTSVGMSPDCEAAPIEDPAFYEKIADAMDCIYTPARTRFMEYVEKAGGRACNGLDMLLYQGVISYELWNPGVQVEESAIAEAGRRIRARLENPGSDRILVGFMGAGKTTVGRALASQLGAGFCDLDQAIEKEAGMSVSEIFAREGEDGFRKRETALLRRLAEEKKGGDGQITVYSTGGGMPVRPENRALLRELGQVIYLKISPDTVMNRLAGDTTRPLLQGDGGRERVEALMALRDPIYEETAHFVVQAEGRSIEAIVAEIANMTKK